MWEAVAVLSIRSTRLLILSMADWYLISKGFQKAWKILRSINGAHLSAWVAMSMLMGDNPPSRLHFQKSIIYLKTSTISAQRLATTHSMYWVRYSALNSSTQPTLSAISKSMQVNLPWSVVKDEVTWMPINQPSVIRGMYSKIYTLASRRIYMPKCAQVSQPPLWVR